MCQNVESSVCSWQYRTLPGYYWDVQLLNNWNASHSCGCSLGGRSQKNTVGWANKTDARAASSSPLLRSAELRALLFRSRLFRDLRFGGWGAFTTRAGGAGVSDAAAAPRGKPDALHNPQRCPAACFFVYFSLWNRNGPNRVYFLLTWLQ